MRSFRFVAGQLWLAQIFTSLIASAPTTDNTQLISARQDNNDGPDVVPAPDGYQLQQCSRAKTNPWEAGLEGQKAQLTTFANEGKSDSSKPATDGANNTDTNTTPGTDTVTTDYAPTAKRQAAVGVSTCEMVAHMFFNQAKDTYRTGPTLLGAFKNQYFLSWKMDGLMKITMWTMRKGEYWERTTLESGTNLQNALKLEGLDDVAKISFDFSLQPNDHGGVKGEVALFHLSDKPQVATA